MQYFIFFADSNNHSEVKILQSGQVEKKYTHLQDDVVTRVGIDWREAFKRAYEGILEFYFMTNKTRSWALGHISNYVHLLF